jgi:amino acid adenylation domain-containing protein
MNGAQSAYSEKGQAPIVLFRAPMTAAAERLWFLQQLDPGDSASNMAFVQRFRGPLDIAALGRAVDLVVERHEPLRTRYGTGDDGRPYQEVLAPHHVPVPIVEVSDSDGSPDEVVARAEAAAAAVSNRPFDLAADAPFAPYLIRLAPDDHVFGIAWHHICGDGWSLSVFAKELADAYEAARLGTSGVLEPLPVSYQDYVTWNRERTRGAESSGLQAYWTEQLREAPILDLPTDFVRPAAHVGWCHTVEAGIDAELTAALQRLARKERGTLFVALLAGYVALLARHSGQDDFCVGTAFAGRERTEWEPLIGYLVETVVMRQRLGEVRTVRDLMRTVRSTAFDAFEHRGLPFEQLLEVLRLPRDLARIPIFQTLFVMQNAGPTARPEAYGDLVLAPFESGLRQARFDLQAEVLDDGPTKRIRLYCAADLFTAETTQALLDRYLTLLRQLAAAEPDTLLDDLDPLTPADRAALDAASAGPALTEPVDSVIAEIRRRAAESPDAVAVSLSGAEGTEDTDTAESIASAQISYAELDRRSDAVARYLRARGVMPSSVVGVCLPRRPELIIALLAVLKAGAAYLPLDPQLPASRLRAMADEQADLVLAGPQTAGLLEGITVPCHEDWEIAVTTTGESEPLPVANGDDPAYVIFTSGSTGQPKAVAVSRAALDARVAWMRADYGLTPQDRVLQLAAINFDTHVEEIFPCLAAGARLELLPGAAAVLPDFLGSAAGRAITVLDLPTSLWHELVAYLPHDAWPAALRLVILGGEQVQSGPLATWHEAFGDRVRLVNTYGPTEATVIATRAELTGPETGSVPIGSPVAGTHIYVLDAELSRVPPGVIGELCIGGAGVALGYRGREEETRVRFVADPYGPPGARLYRTGDRARQRPDGRFEFVGRVDRQVKIRGCRVEPGEVEAALTAHPTVASAFVDLRGGALVGYVSPRASGEVDLADLRRDLAQRLPDYMRPSSYVVFAALPLTVNGKIDVAALPEPAAGEHIDKAEVAAPATDAELLIADVWSEMLGRRDAGPDEFDVHDDFFSIGGNSLHLVAVAARLRSLVGVDVPIRTLFTQRSIARLAVTVEDLIAADLQQLSDDEVERQLAPAAEG